MVNIEEVELAASTMVALPCISTQFVVQPSDVTIDENSREYSGSSLRALKLPYKSMGHVVPSVCTDLFVETHNVYVPSVIAGADPSAIWCQKLIIAGRLHFGVVCAVLTTFSSCRKGS